MNNFIKWLLGVLVLMSIWTILNVISMKEGWLLDIPAEKDNPQEFMDYSVNIIKQKSKGNISYLLIQDGEIFDEFSRSIGRKVNKNTVFGVSSLSKWVTSVGIMALVEAGKLELDNPVSKYLTRWKLPDSQFNNDKVTVRGLLSHTAGITDGLGHNGFATANEVQPLVEHLTQALDADEGISGKVAVGIEPGSEWKYSGGSYNLLQLIIEEVSGVSFESYMKTTLFKPLGMTSTGYQKPINEDDLAVYYDEEGNPRMYPFYTSLAATGLYTTTADMYQFLAAHVKGENGEKIGRGVLSEKSLKEMREVHGTVMGLDIWGAGPMLFVDSDNDYIIGHGGQSPSLNTTARINPTNGNGIIIFATGNKSLSADIAMQWTLWEAGKPGMYILKNTIPKMIKMILVGYAAIFILSLIVVWVRMRRAKN